MAACSIATVSNGVQGLEGMTVFGERRTPVDVRSVGAQSGDPAPLALVRSLAPLVRQSSITARPPANIGAVGISNQGASARGLMATARRIKQNPLTAIRATAVGAAVEDEDDAEHKDAR